MPVKFTENKGWSEKQQRSMKAGLLEMATDIHRRAVILAPIETGALRNSGKITPEGSDAYKISFGSSKVPYARMRHFVNKKNPQTLGYLAKAGDSVARGAKEKYFKGL